MASNAPAPAESDWTEDVTNRIESLVSTVRQKTTVPATVAARGVVFGVVVGVLAAALLFLLVLGVIRILDVYLPFHPRARRVWVVYTAASAIFLASGAFLWRKRRPRSA